MNHKGDCVGPQKRVRSYILRFLLGLIGMRGRLRLAKIFFDPNDPSWMGFNAIIPYIRDMRIEIHTKDIIGWRIFFSGEHEPETNFLLAACCNPGDHALDAGANIGSESLLLAKLAGSAGIVYAFEPVPHVFQQLVRNIEINNFSKTVIAVSNALGERADMVPIHLMPHDSPNQGMSSTFSFPEATSAVYVRQETLDDWLAGGRMPRLDLLKMDVQGAELSVLRGAERCICRHLPVIVAEAGTVEQSQAGSTLVEFWFELDRLGYDVWSVSRSCKISSRISDERNLVEGTWIAFPKSRNAAILEKMRRLAISDYN